MKISNALLSRHDEIKSQGQSNLHSFICDSYSGVNVKGVLARNYKANQREEIKFGKCLSCGTFHSRNSCAFHYGDPVFLQRRIIPHGLREAVHKTSNNLRAKDVIEPIQYSECDTHIVTPLKSNDKTPRICGDYRLTLNSRLLKQTCTTVDAEDILNRLHGSKVFSKVHLKDAYLRIPLDQSSSILTTINTPFGLFKYNFLPFGLSCSPAIFQEVMNKVVSDLEGVEVYRDDLIVHGSNKVVHDQRLIALMRRLVEKNITVNPNNCSF
ncbi:unnamed protein product [Schistosoma mattheei]|uniref:Reverse transcriptase domain-containing protein n=1 Tax=Schistosoma mattheei TaxID=31246 RepID=A0A183Q3I2_9TREM|nr:unnamed protein product [Schistosoma mattheei]